MPVTKNYTPIEDTDAKLDIMEHVNQDHPEEVLIILKEYHPNLDAEQAVIKDIFEEGMLVEIHTEQEKKSLFVEFELKGELEEQILYLAYMAMAKQGKDLTGNKKQYFEVVDKQKITKNMTRLTLQSQTPLPSEYAGYAYGMILKALNKAPEKQTSEVAESKPIKLVKRYTTQAFLWVLKKASSARRQKIVETMNKDIRLYTLRKAWQSDDADFINQGYMDVFMHENSPGSLWTESLNIGDVVFSRTETDDKHGHLHTGQAVLIADEAAYPALAGILDLWQNPLPPYVVILSQKESEQSYFKNEDFPKDSIIHRIVAPVAIQAQQVIQVIEGIETIDSTWGALENKQAKAIRHYLRNERGLTGKQNHIKSYWRQDKTIQ